MMSDPFLLVQTDVIEQLHTTENLLAAHQRLTFKGDGITQWTDGEQAQLELDKALQILRRDVEDLSESVIAVERNPARYGIEQEEVERRRKFVSDVKLKVQNMQEELNSLITSASSQRPTDSRHAPANKRLLNTSISKGSDYEFGDSSNELDYTDLEMQRQTEILNDQDETLNNVFQTVGVLRQQANTMGRELEEQSELLNSVDRVADRFGSKIQVGLSRMNELLRRNEDSLSSFCIGILVLLLLVILALLLIL